jgi:hypothetical protein
MKKNKPGQLPPKISQVSREGVFLGPISGKGKRSLVMGMVLTAIGFIGLRWTDPMGRNWASFAFPCLILAGYVMIGLGLF